MSIGLILRIKILTKELIITKEDDDNIEKSTKCWICGNDYVHSDVKVSDHWQITGK